MGKVDYIKEAIERVQDSGADAIKFQLFPNESPYVGTGNVWLSPDLYLQAAEYARSIGLECSASVFDYDSFQFLLQTNPSFIKFAYSKKEQIDWVKECLANDIEAIVSCDIMTDRKVPKEATRLFCIPQYPVYFQVRFDEIFPRFHGFSDHTLGVEQTLEAVDAGAKIIEKHVMLHHRDITCPDAAFSISMADLTNLVTQIRRDYDLARRG